jgi:hypothetical protein
VYSIQIYVMKKKWHFSSKICIFHPFPFGFNKQFVII